MSKQSLLSGTVCNTLVQVSQSTKRRKSTWLGTRADFPTHRSDFKDFKMKQNLKAFLLSLLPFWKGNQERIGRQQKQSQPESDPMVRCIYLGTSGTGPSTFSLYKLLKVWNALFSLMGAVHAQWAVSSSGVCYSQGVLLKIQHIILENIHRLGSWFPTPLYLILPLFMCLSPCQT